MENSSKFSDLIVILPFL